MASSCQASALLRYVFIVVVKLWGYQWASSFRDYSSLFFCSDSILSGKGMRFNDARFCIFRRKSDSSLSVFLEKMVKAARSLTFIDPGCMLGSNSGPE